MGTNTSTTSKYKYIVGLLLLASLMNGCAGIRPYPNSLDKNLHILTETESGSLFSKVRATVNIYQVDTNCKAEYKGTLKLNNPSVAVGIRPDSLTYLVFEFAGYSFLANSSSRISYDTMLKTRTGYNYKIKVSYIDDIYNVDIREVHLSKPASRDIERMDLSACSAF
jgi:hypothetical protein